MNKLSWTTVQKRINDLIPQEVNPRRITDKQMSDLTQSLKKFNLVEIPAVDYDGTILAGHQRIKALQLLGRGDEMIDTRVPNRKLTNKEAKEYLIGSNKLGGDWDYDALKAFDIDMLTDVGFDQLELSEFWDKDLETKEDTFKPEKEVRKIHSTDIQLGDLIRLGKHKLLCADSTDPEAVRALFGDERTAMIYSDPIYNIGLSYDRGVGNKSSYGGTVDDNKTPAEYRTFIQQIMQATQTVAYPDTHYFYWCDESYVWLFQTLYNELGIKNRRLNIWLKNNASPTPQVAFNKVIEYCVYGTTGSPYLSNETRTCTEVQNKELGTGNSLLEDLSNVWSAKRLKSKEYEHATSKPPTLHEKAIKRCSKPGDIILDSFSGSASTLIAAHQLKRRVYSLEIDPVFCELAIRRYKHLTGEDAQITKKFYEKV